MRLRKHIAGALEKVDDYLLDSEWFPYAVIRHAREIPWHIRRVKYFFVRGWKGWAPMDTWSFDSYLSRVISEGLKHMAENSNGYKLGLCGVCKKTERGLGNDWRSGKRVGRGGCTCERDWPLMLEKISRDIKAADEFEGDHKMYEILKTDDKEYSRLRKLAYAKQKRALLLLAANFNGMWD